MPRTIPAILAPTPGNTDPYWGGPPTGYEVGEWVLVVDDKNIDHIAEITAIDQKTGILTFSGAGLRAHHSWVVGRYGRF